MATEADKVKDRVLELLRDRDILDIGCGSKKIVPWATSVDHYDPHAEFKVDVDAASKALEQLLNGRTFDVVFSSHCLEHMRSPILETLRYWIKFVKPGGSMILYLPDESRYVFHPTAPLVRNPEHFHYLTPDVFHWYLDQLAGVVVERFEQDPPGKDLYSFLCILRKVS
jgi:SAM-dependent methyltransferase